MKISNVWSLLLVAMLALVACNNEKSADANNELEAEGMEEMTMLSPEDISDAELEKFVEILMSMEPAGEAAQMRMIQAIQNEGLDVEQYVAIQQNMMNPEAQDNVSAGDMAKYDKANAEVEKIQESSMAEMEKMVEAQGMSVKRYESIMMAIQMNPELLQKVMGLMSPEMPME